MVFMPAPSIRQRQQVVELEGGVDESQSYSCSTKSSECAKSQKMPRHTPNNFDPSSEEIPLQKLGSPHTSHYNTDELIESEESFSRASNNNMSLRSSQSLYHLSEMNVPKITDNVQDISNLHPHIRFAYSDFGGEQYVPNKSPARFSSHKSEDNVEDGSLSKQIDSTRRDAVMTLSEKREKKAELVRKESKKSKQKTIGIYKLAKYSIGMSFQKFIGAIGSVSYNLELWYSSIKLIEGNFGSGVASYFKFLRWLLLLNFTTLIISLSFLIIPQTLNRFYINSYEVPDVAKNGDTYLEKGFHDPPDTNGTFPPPITAAALLQRSDPYHNNSKFSVDDIFTGEGFLTATTMYYGFYSAGTVELIPGYPYDLPNAYFFSMVVCYLIILITVSVSMAHSYRKTYIETRGTQKGSLALKVFCGWDFSIATDAAASLNKRRMYNEIKEALNEEEFQKRELSCLSRFSNITIQITLNLMFFLLMAGIAFFMWNLMGRHSARLVDSESNSNTMIMAVVTSLIMNVLPIGFSWIVKYEDYRNPRTALYVTLLRTFLLNIIVIGTITFFWLTHSQECWETALGQEVYRLFITDFIISVLLMGLVETAWSWIQRKRSGSERPEFDIAWNTLNLIYNETLFLVGFYFSPMLAAVIVIKLFITFYIKKAGALYNCQPPKKSWRAAQTQTLFLILTFIALLCVFLVFGYTIFRVPPSSCGPFGGFAFMYEAILNGIFQLQKGNMFWEIVMYLVKPGVVGGILIAMSIATYILHAKAQAHSIEVDILTNMMINEKKDKAFLFKCIKRTEEAIPKKGSPALSSSSSFHTPLSQRRQLKRASKERQSNLLLSHNTSSGLLHAQRKFHSTSQLASESGWSYIRGNQRPDATNQPSTSSGARAKGATHDSANLPR